MVALDRANEQLGTSLGGKITMLKGDLQDMIRRMVIEFKRDLQNNGVRYDTRVDRWLEEQEKHSEVSDNKLPTERLTKIIVDYRDMAITMNFLRTLQYRTMRVRQSKIAEAHQETFQWIYETKFAEWLESEGSVYWVSGKPGSGKSTLMKFLAHNPDTLKHLKVWAMRRKLVVAKFFFWIAGTDVQKSQEGLLRSILYDICMRCPNLIPDLSPIRWQECSLAQTGLEMSQWTVQELIDTTLRLQKHSTTTAFCLFIDGLDEYEGQHSTLITLIESLRSSNMKICLSSRPWNVFEIAFGNGLNPKVYIQDLTASDFRIYVKDQLESRTDFQEMRDEGGRCNELIEEIIQKAQGVFLWVYLVVRSLIEGLENCDSMKYLQLRLREFPSDLQDYFMHIFTSLSPIYRIPTAKAFQITLAASQTLTVFNHWFIDLEEDDINYATSDYLQPLDDTALYLRKVQMERRLLGRYKCLLEVSEDKSQDVPFRYRVDFLHRTVRDFLKTEDIQRMLWSWMGESFNVDMAICKSTVAEIQTLKIKLKYLEKSSPLKDLVDQALAHAREVEVVTEGSPVQVLDRMALFISAQTRKLLERHTKSRIEPWGTVWNGKDSLLSYAVTARLDIYVQQKLDEDPSLARRSKSAWEHFLRVKASAGIDSTGKLYKMIKRCIDSGADLDMLAIYILRILPPQDAKELLKPSLLPRKKTRFSIFRR
jgi:hypothetical protein